MPCAPTSTITGRPIWHAIELDRRIRVKGGKAQPLSHEWQSGVRYLLLFVVVSCLGELFSLRIGPG